VRLINTGLGTQANVPVVDLTLMLAIEDKQKRPQ